MTYIDPRSEDPPVKKGISGRAIVGIVVAILVVGFIALNRDVTTIHFLFFDAQMPLWIVLAIVAALGFIVGFLIGRKRYRVER